MMEFSGRSDPNAVADYIVELSRAPISAQYQARRGCRFSYWRGTESFTKGMPDSERRLLFQRILAKAPRASVVLIHGARHFVQDQSTGSRRSSDRDLSRRPGDDVVRGEMRNGIGHNMPQEAPRTSPKLSSTLMVFDQCQPEEARRTLHLPAMAHYFLYSVFIN